MNRRNLLSVHRWVAMMFAPFLALQAITGGLLLFHEPLAHLLHPAATLRSPTGVAAPVSQLVTSAERRFPNYALTRIFLPAASDSTAFAWLESRAGDTKYAALDPGTGKVLAAGGLWRFPMEAVLQLHFQLMAPAFGMWVIAANGIALLVLGSTGVLNWWPGQKRLAGSLKIRKGLPSHLMLRQYHRTLGAIGSLVLLFSAITGLTIAIANLPGGVGPVYDAPVSNRLKSSAIDGAVALAQAQFPGAVLRDIRFRPDGRMDVNLFAPERNSRAVHVASVSATEQRVLRSVPAADNDAIWIPLLPLHAGDSFGLAGRLVLLAGAAIILFLSVSGPLAWWRGRRPRKR